MRHNKCPRCGGDTRCLAGHSAHGHNWFCANETGCGWQAWNQSAPTPPTKDPRDETLREARKALEQIAVLAEYNTTGPGKCRSEKLTAEQATSLRKAISDIAREAIRQIKELAGEK